METKNNDAEEMIQSAKDFEESPFQKELKRINQMEKVFILSESQLKDQLSEYLDWIGSMGWYREPDGTWHHDDETGGFQSTKKLVEHYSPDLPKEIVFSSDDEIQKQFPDNPMLSDSEIDVASGNRHGAKWYRDSILNQLNK